ncbi:polysaccharide pyruvyl transferase family protein [uncultured Sphingomonas sp.]|uniref:polysaccharide pyruvyl transferase family protein n=1 Tax=uncultured Sphingomonas sp. TaxID=158754 RepID=UPI0025CEE638|nr:polysaccharide pyruvyl transferase family protein [uncultured Sphingomonas sp.]
MADDVRKRIGVLTFHRCINYGSYWQARCLVEGLRARGHDVMLLNHDSRRVNWKEARCAFQPLLPERTARADFPLYAAKTRKFLAAFDAMPTSPRFPLDQPEMLPPYDVVVVGSDEVWNQRHPWYGGQATFYGTKVKAGQLVSYAASFGNHNASEGLEPWWAEQLRNFSSISVRDENSRQIIVAALGIEPAMVLDPVLQFPPDSTDVGDGDDGEQAPYLLVYGHNFPDWYRDKVRAWADRQGLRVVSLGYRNEWADEQRIDAGPHDFARMMRATSAVATNFFHGCVFALINGKPFACASSTYRNNKVRDLLHGLDGAHHLLDENSVATDYAAALGQPLAPAIGARIEELRRSSNQYLDHVLA